MPSETPRMPGQTHKSLLNYGSSKNLGLLADEVAWYPNRSDPDKRAVRYAKRIGTFLLVLGVAASVIGFVIQAS